MNIGISETLLCRCPIRGARTRYLGFIQSDSVYPATTLTGWKESELNVH